MLRLALMALGVALCAPLYADLIERAAPGKTEAELVAQFEEGLTAFLGARAKEAEKPRVRVTINKRPVYLECVELKEGELTWAELVCNGWYPDKFLYGFAPSEVLLKFKAADIPPVEVAGCFNVPYRLPAEVVALAAWLVAKGELMTANAKLAELHKGQEPWRADIEAWLLGKHGWDAGAKLELVNTHDLKAFRDGALLLTAEAAAERLKALDKEAKDVLKELQARQGNDVKSKPGARKNPPQIRLDTLQSRLERFALAYAGTATLDNKTARKALDETLAAVKADRQWTEDQGFKADRLAIEGDKPACADAWIAILRVDPENPVLLQNAAKASYEAAGVKDNGLKADKPERALKAAELWEKIGEIWPLMLNARNFAGLNYMAAGKRDKAKANFQEVLRRTEKPELSDTEKQNRTYAEARLKALK